MISSEISKTKNFCFTVKFFSRENSKDIYYFGLLTLLFDRYWIILQKKCQIRA